MSRVWRQDLAWAGLILGLAVLFGLVQQWPLVRTSWRGELEITDAIRRMMKSGKYRVVAHKVTGWWDDTGTIEAVLNANTIVLSDLKGENLGEVDEGARVVGHVKIGRGTKILRNSVVKGPSIIGENCLIGPDTVIGSYTSIGNGVTIEGAEIESSIVYNNVRITYKGRIVDSIIGESSEIAITQQSPKGDRLIIGSHSRISRSI